MGLPHMENLERQRRIEGRRENRQVDGEQDQLMQHAYSTDDSSAEAEIEDALSRHKTRLQAALGRQLTMKFTPKLTFIADDAFDKADHMNRLIQGLPQAS